jgi:Rrf2 family cysteine metabolism transcriptional repressor
MLKLSTKGRYAVRIMIYLSSRDQDIPARKRDIAEAEAISPDYVEQILIRLRASGMVQSHRGARGGFTVACDPHRTSILDVLEATEGPLQLAPCVDTQCDLETRCAVQEVYGEATAALKAVFAKAFLSDLADKANTLRAGSTLTYSI